jgi:8-oxo-dGTP pyrophosphatase MutT (NUDIX family)
MAGTRGHPTGSRSPAHLAGSGDMTAGPRKHALKPKDAATLVLVDHARGEPRILMGCRQSTHVFLPDKYVFPGGRVDRGDRTMPSLSELPATDQELLLRDMKGTPSAARIRALALAAVRETFEEAGLIVGAQPPDADRQALAMTVRRAAHDSWQRFLDTGYMPSLSSLTFLARAITPPARPRRYDTRFFLADASQVAHASANRDDELRNVGWFTLDEIRNLDLPNITRAIVEDIAQRLAAPGRTMPVPYYRFERGAFRRDLIS